MIKPIGTAVSLDCWKNSKGVTPSPNTRLHRKLAVIVAPACREWDCRCENHCTLLFHSFLFLHLGLDPAGWDSSLYPLYLFCLLKVLFNISCFRDGLSDRINLRRREFMSIYLKTRVFSPRLLEQTIMVQECVVEGHFFLPDATGSREKASQECHHVMNPSRGC